MKHTFIAIILVTALLFPLSDVHSEELNFYELRSSLINHNNQTIPLDQFKGHPVLVTMFYASCRSACPATISKIKRITNNLPSDVAKKLRIMLISFDPQRDTPKTLATVIKDHELDVTQWQLAIPKNHDDVRMLAAAISLNFRKIDNGEFGHTSPVAILDDKGNIKFSGEITPDSETIFLTTISSLLKAH